MSPAKDTAEAGALELQASGEEVAAIILQNAYATAAREGREINDADVANLISPLLSAAWVLAKFFGPDEDTARRRYVDFLRGHADGVAGD